MKTRKRRWLDQAGVARASSGVLAKAPGGPPTVRVAFTWYRAKDWGRLRELAADLEVLEETHAEWLENAGRAVEQLRRNGIVVKKVLLDVDAALAWSRRERRPFNSAARAAFVAAVAGRRAEAPDQEEAKG